MSGLAVGDALGMPTEFLTPEQMATEYGMLMGLVSPAKWHLHASLPYASTTDDTAQALALAEIYLRGERMTAEHAAQVIWPGPMRRERGWNCTLDQALAAPWLRCARLRTRARADGGGQRTAVPCA